MNPLSDFLPLVHSDAFGCPLRARDLLGAVEPGLSETGLICTHLEVYRKENNDKMKKKTKTTPRKYMF